MRPNIAPLLVCVTLLLSLPLLGRSHSHSSYGSHSHSSYGSHSHSSYGSHSHSSYGSHSHSSYGSHSHSSTLSYTPYKNNHLAYGYTAHPSVQYDKNGKIKRSERAKNDFKHQQPCPANGNSSGSCPGYVIDHVKPLECGGADTPSNMQWQTVADGKAKDKTERYCR
jgi:hypothetical protein